jgi:tetratricopeptide (TPR) repeat protein
MKPGTYIFIFLFVSTSARCQCISKPEFEIVEKVYANIIKAVGDSKNLIPELCIRDRVKRVASFHKKNNQIILEIKAIEICSSMGKHKEGALAFLLGHELSHFYQDHDWKEVGFGTSFFSDNATYNSHAQEEKDADLYGAFLARLAGYEIDAIIPLLIENIYKGYCFDDESMSNYPPLTIRLNAAIEACSLNSDLVDIFDAANYFMVAGKYGAAKASYEYLLQFIKHKEIYNNLGLSQFALAINIPSRNNFHFEYPMEIEVNTSIRGANLYDRKELLQGAISNLEKAVILNSSYFTAWDNLIAAYIEIKRFKEAKALIDQVRSITNSKQSLAKLDILEGILLAGLSEYAAAKAKFKQAKSKYAKNPIKSLVRSNLKALEGNDITSKSKSFSLPKVKDVMDAFEFAPSHKIEYDNSYLLEADFHVEINLKQLSNSKLAAIQLEDKFMTIQWTSSASQATRQGLKTRDTWEESLYNDNDYKVISNKYGYYIYYQDLGLILQLDKNNVVREWGILNTL